MQWEFSLSWFLIGIAVIIAGSLLIIFHKWIADTFLGGLGSYQKVKLWGVVAIGIGFLCVTNIHSMILYGLLQLIMPSIFNK